MFDWSFDFHNVSFTYLYPNVSSYLLPAQILKECTRIGPCGFLGTNISSAEITVCTVVQNCCNGRSKKYTKWHFWGCSFSETLQRIDIKFGRDDYVGDESQYPKWHINRFRDVISAKGWNVNGLCFFYFFLFFVRSLAPLGVKPLDRFWRVIRQNACFWVSCIPFRVRTMTSQF